MSHIDVGLGIAEAILGKAGLEGLYKLELVLEAGCVPRVYTTYHYLPEGAAEVIAAVEGYTLVPNTDQEDHE